MGHTGQQLTRIFFSAVCLSSSLLPAVVHGAPTTLLLQGAAGELQFPGAPLTTAEAQELSQKFAGEVTLQLVYDAATTTPDSGSFHYVSPSGPAFELIVTNATGTSTFSFSEYRLFLDDQAHVDTLVFTPFLTTDATVTLSTTTMVQVDIGLIWQDPTGTTLSSSSQLPAALDLSKLNVRGYSFIFIEPATGFAIGSMKGALAPQLPPSGAVCGNGDPESGEDCDPGADVAGDCCAATCQFEADGVGCGDPGTECVQQDTCDAAGSCIDNGPREVGTPCGSAAESACDHPDACDAAGTCQPNQEPDGASCSDGNACTNPDACQGGACAGVPLTCGGRNATLCGSAGKNTLHGTSGPDVIHGLGGDDTIYGKGGDDKICGGEGWDVLYGESGNDFLDGGSGWDRCSGGLGADSSQSCESNNP